MDLPAESVSSPVPPAADIHGLADTISRDRISGWALDGARPGHRLTLLLRLGQQVLGTTLADQSRPDLLDNNVGDGCHGFEFLLKPEDIARAAEFSLVALSANGQEVPIPLRLRRVAARPAPVAPRGAAAAPAGEPGRGLREDIAALARRLDELPAARTLHALPAQGIALAEQLRALAQRLEAMPDAGSLNALAEQLRNLPQLVDQRLAATPGLEQLDQVTQQQKLVMERMAALETWLARLDERLGEAPASATAPQAAPRQVDLWQKVLFGVLVGALGLALLISLLLRAR